jgi:predicted nucleic acid-binding protein
VTVKGPVVLDASVGVKWFRDEPGSAEAQELLRRHGRGEIELVVPSLFVYEVVGVATRVMSTSDVRAFWDRFLSWRIGVREVGGALLEEALLVREKLGCSFYDAVAPALASELGGRLCSADRRAHGTWPGVELLG